jgi:hypothetical protein
MLGVAEHAMAFLTVLQRTREYCRQCVSTTTMQLVYGVTIEQSVARERDLESGRARGSAGMHWFKRHRREHASMTSPAQPTSLRDTCPSRELAGGTSRPLAPPLLQCPLIKSRIPSRCLQYHAQE